MRKQIRRTKQLRRDIIDIYRYIYERNPRAAENVLDAIERSIKSLLDTPGIGRIWDSPDPRLQAMRIAIVTPYRNYLIFYRPSAHGVEVYRLIHGARELGRIMDDIDIEF